MAGLTGAGLEIKSLSELQEEVAADLVATFGPNTRTGSDSVFGQLMGVFNAQLALVWEIAQQLYDSFDPDQAEGSQLDNLAALVGVSRQGATFSTGTITITGNANTVILAGSIVENSTVGSQFETIAEVTLPDTGAPAGTETVSATIRGTETGPLVALSGDIDTIVTPIAGWLSVTNAEDIDEGQDAETDAELRLRREESLQIVGASVDAAIRANIKAISGVEEALVISNRSSVTDGDGRPPHSFETIVYPNPADPSFDLTIAETIWSLQPAGIEAHGSLSFTVTDTQGFDQTVKFTYATEVAIYADVTLTVGPEYPADGDAQVAAAVLAEGNTLSVGDDILHWKFIAALDAIPGIQTVVMEIDNLASPVETSSYAINFNQIAGFDSSRITVTST